MRTRFCLIIASLLAHGVRGIGHIRRASRSQRVFGYPGKKGLSPDARVAVIVLNSCDEPLQAHVIAAENPDPAVAVRILRRIVLTARKPFPPRQPGLAHG